MMRQTIIHSAVLSAILTLGASSVVAAEGSIIDENRNFDTDTTIIVSDKYMGENSQWSGIGVTQNKGEMIVNIADGTTVTVVGERDGGGRVYGTSAQANSSLIINGDTSFSLTNTNNQAKAVRANGGSITFNGNTTITTQTNSSDSVGVDAWYGSNVLFKGTTSIHSQSASGLTVAVQNKTNSKTVSFEDNVDLTVTTDGTGLGVVAANGSTTNFGGESTQILVQSSDGGKLVGVNNYDASGATINFDSNTTTINVINATNVNEFTEGVKSFQSTTNFLGNTTINVVGGLKTTYGVDVQCNPGNTFGSIVNFNGEKTVIEVSAQGTIEAVRPSGVPGKINFNGKEVFISATSTEAAAFGIQSLYGAHLNSLGDVTIKASGKSYAVAVSADQFNGREDDSGDWYAANVSIGGDLKADVYSESGTAIGILNQAKSEIVVSDQDGVLTIDGSTDLNVVAKEGNAIGILVNGNYAEATFDAVNVTATAENSGATASGIVAENSNLSIDNGATIVTNGENTVGINSIGAEILLNGNSVITAEQAISADNTTIISVGTEDRASQLTVNGTVNNEGKTNLTNAAYTVNGSGSELGTIDSKSSSTLAFGEGTYDVANLLSDDTTTVLLNDLSDATQITIAEKKGRMVRAASGVANDQFGSAQDAAKALQDKLSITNDTSVPGTTDDVLIEEGAVNNRLTAKVDAEGNLSDVAETKNTKLDALGSVSALSAMTLRHEMNSLSKRMGELRDAPAGVGTWARYYGSEMEYGTQNLTSKNNTIQIGSDYAVGDWKVGVAANYTDGESSYDNGSADNKNYGFAVYGIWFVPCGAYVDLIAKYSRMDNDFALNGMNGSYENNAFNVSAETGYRFEFMDGGLFVEPQVGLSYGRIMGDDFTAQNGVRVEQDDYDSLIGRVGVRTGFKFPKDKGLIYARVSGLYDFQGEMNATATSGSARNTIEEDLGGAWLELGVGANFNWTDNTYSYIDIERTNGGDVKENYRFNVGIRHTF